MESKDRCLVCNSKIRQLHLKVAACRACAVFFRRSVQANIKYECLSNGKCDLTLKSEGQPLCRFCRFEKCKEIGMKLLRKRRKTKLDPPKNSISSPSTQSSISIEFRTAPLVSECSCCSSIERKQWDMQPIEQKIKETLAQTPITLKLPRIRLTFLQQLCLNFPEFYDNFRPKTSVIVTNQFDRMSHFVFMQKFWVELAKLLMKCDQFAELNFDDKWLLYKRVWAIFFKIERHYTSIQVFGNSFNDTRTLYDDMSAQDYSRNDLTIKELSSREKCEQWQKLWFPLKDRYVNTIINPLKILQLTEFELVYMLAQILWSTRDINGLTDATIRLSEEISNQISNEFHDYYIHERHLTNYASRLTNINKVISATEACINAKKDYCVLAKIFNVFDLEVIGTELCDG